MLIDLLFISLFLPLGLVLGFGKTVTIGGLFEDDEIIEKAFELSAKTLSEERHGNDELPDQFIEARLTVIGDDTYRISPTVCALANSGVAAIFGPQNDVTGNFVSSMCDTMDIPHVSARWDSKQRRGDGFINMYPYSHSLSTVYFQLVKDYNWKTFTILYENMESLIRTKQLLERWDHKGHSVTIRQLPEGPDYREILRDIKHSGDPNIVLDCSIALLPEVLKQAQQVGIMSDKHSYIITCLDLQTIDLEPYQYGGTNFTGFRLVDPDDYFVQKIFTKDFLKWGLESPSQLTVESALIYDGVQLFGRALKQLDNSRVDVATDLCKNNTSWKDGSSLITFMKLTEMRGLTGLIKFDQTGHRSDFKLDILNLDLNGLGKIGTWEAKSGIEYLPQFKASSHIGEPSLKNKTFIVLIAITPPYGMLSLSAKEETGNDRYEGFGIDIIKELSEDLGFNYTFEVQTDDIYGSKDKITGEWNGMIRKIMDDQADLAITDLTITADREEAVDFTMPFMNLGISILFRKPEPAGANLFSFLSPFSKEVWMYLMITYSLVSLLLFTVGRLCPSEWNNPYPCIEEPEELENQFSLKNSFWFTIGSIMQQGSEIAPIGLSTRMMAGSWWFFCLIIVSSYTANLAVFLVIESKQVLIKNAEELANNKHGIKYGAKGSGSTMDFFRASDDPIYKKMREYMEENAKEVLLSTNDKGVQKVLDDNYAFLMESSTIAYQVERRCKLNMVGDLLDAKGYGIAMKKNSSYRNALSTSILKLQETGVLRNLENKWWKQKRGGGNCGEKKGGTSDAEALGLDNVGGVFVVLIAGTALSCFYTAWELIWEVGCTSIKENVSFKEELKEEIKFVVKCSASNKPVRRRKGSSHSDQSNDEESTRHSTPPYGFVPTVITTTAEEREQ